MKKEFKRNLIYEGISLNSYETYLCIYVAVSARKRKYSCETNKKNVNCFT